MPHLPYQKGATEAMKIMFMYKISCGILDEGNLPGNPTKGQSGPQRDFCRLALDFSMNAKVLEMGLDTAGAEFILIDDDTFWQLLIYF